MHRFGILNVVLCVSGILNFEKKRLLFERERKINSNFVFLQWNSKSGSKTWIGRWIPVGCVAERSRHPMLWVRILLQYILPMRFPFICCPILTENGTMIMSKLWWHRRAPESIYDQIKWMKRTKIFHRDDVTIKHPSFRATMLTTFDIWPSLHTYHSVYCVRNFLPVLYISFFFVLYTYCIVIVKTLGSLAV